MCMNSILTVTAKCSCAKFDAKLDRAPKFKPASNPRLSMGMRSIPMAPEGAPPVNEKEADALLGFWLKSRVGEAPPLAEPDREALN